MDIDIDEDLFDDDDEIDTLPASTLHELERNALQSKHSAAHMHTKHPQIPLTDTAAGQGWAVNGKSANLVYNDESVQPAESDYGDDEAEVIDLDAEEATFPANRQPVEAVRPIHRQVDEVTQREQWRQQRYGAPSRQTFAQTPFRPPRPIAQPNRYQAPSQARHAALDAAPRQGGTQLEDDRLNFLPQDQSIDVTTLQARIAELEDERTRFQKAADEARSNAMARAGEIAIVRANHEKATKEHEKRLAELRLMHTEELTKQKNLLEMARKDREMVETNNRFLEHDLAQEAEKVRNAKKGLKDGHGAVPRSRDVARGSPASTPRKNRALPFRDGFDENEVMVLSPSRSDRSKQGTPKAGAKRKRSATDRVQSPAQQLSFSEPERTQDPMVEPAVPQADGTVLSGAKEVDGEEKFEFVQMILHHRSSPEKDRSFEVLTKYRFASGNGEPSMSTMLYDLITLNVPEENAEGFCLRFCKTLMDIWSRCLAEKFHTPLYDLTELLQYILVVSPSPLSVALAPRAVHLCIQTIDLIAFPTAKASRGVNSHELPSAQLYNQIDPSDYLKTLEILALNCSLHKDELQNFWTTVQFEFILTMLHKAQPLIQIKQMLQLLGLSILPASFGAIIPEASPMSPQQMKIELDTVDRLTVLLFETPLHAPETPAYTDLELLDMRSRVLSLLRALCRTRHGGHLLATHRLAFGRLVRFLHESVITLYACRMHTHDATVSHVNLTTLLLAHLTSCHSDVIDVRAKLASMPGGAHRHLVALSRVAFSDGASLLEAGIEPEVAEAAHRMLDEHLSPEEGEAVVEVFSSARAWV